ncbi:MAG: restriction endonuclease [Anaerolineae bacterium]|nr:restriction endonuclease [Anaerolineae bacterium]MBL8106967.1 restriction endonuclease [Anaerolineales bacterium]MCC7188068.1 restriction endonuclease [Anaerolineales bacterium]
MSSSQQKGPQFVRYFQPVIDALTKLGGSGRPEEVEEAIAEQLGLSESERNEQIPSGQSRFSNKVNWARFYLVKAGLIDSSTRGVWSLSEKGRTTSLSAEQALELFNLIHKPFVTDRKRSKAEKVIEDEIVSLEDLDHRSALQTILLEMPAEGFERLCQRLLRESGFEKVQITGKSGDGGLDGIGVLQVNPFVSFKVLFQCKRYSGSVSPSQVRDFRGAMQGRADKGIILTTGSFTADARKEAVRDGVPPIELVDGEKLLDMFEELELGLKPRKAYDIDSQFFDEFRKQ